MLTSKAVLRSVQATQKQTPPPATQRPCLEAMEGGRQRATHFLYQIQHFSHLRSTVFQIACQTLFVPKTAFETRIAPPLMHPGYGARRARSAGQDERADEETHAELAAERAKVTESARAHSYSSS